LQKAALRRLGSKGRCQRYFEFAVDFQLKSMSKYGNAPFVALRKESRENAEPRLHGKASIASEY